MTAFTANSSGPTSCGHRVVGGRISARVDVLARSAVAAAPQAERIIRLEANLDGVVDRVAEIEGLVSAAKEPTRR